MLYDTLYSTYTRENAVMMVASPSGILVREEDTQAKRSVENPRQGWIEEIRDISRRAAKQEKEQGKEETTKGKEETQSLNFINVSRVKKLENEDRRWRFLV